MSKYKKFRRSLDNYLKTNITLCAEYRDDDGAKAPAQYKHYWQGKIDAFKHLQTSLKRWDDETSPKESK